MSEDLTQHMLNDFRPYARRFEDFERIVKKNVKRYGGGVQRIEIKHFPNRPGIMEKRYFFPCDGPDDPLYVLNAYACGEKDSLPA